MTTPDLSPVEAAPVERTAATVEQLEQEGDIAADFLEDLRRGCFPRGPIGSGGHFPRQGRAAGALLEMNPARARFLATGTTPSPPWPTCFPTPPNSRRLFQTLQSGGEVRNHIIHVETSDAAARFISLSARLVRDEQHHPAYIDGMLEDVTTARKQEAGREALIEKLQSLASVPA